jgi:polyribonucleotide nucleotidyltransferase
VKRIQPFGAFVEILPGKDGMVHVSDMSTEFVKDLRDVVNIGDKVQVRVKEIDDLGRINLSMVMDPAYDKEKAERKDRNSNGGGSFRSDRSGRFDRGSRPDHSDRGYRRGGFEKRGYPSQQDRGGRAGFSKGPHFPTSRLLNETKKD